MFELKPGGSYLLNIVKNYQANDFNAFIENLSYDVTKDQLI